MSGDGEVLEALVWAQMTEQVKIAKIASLLVRGSAHGDITESAIKAAVRATKPSHGRGKAIIRGVALEVERQLPIWRKRKDERASWERYQEWPAERGTRLNRVYAARFGRPCYNDADPYRGWCEAEGLRDKGDSCIGIMIHRNDYVVALLACVDDHRGSGNHIAVRNRHGGEAVYTPLRNHCWDFVDAIVSLGGHEVRRALSTGLKVEVDWVARNISVHYRTRTRILPWRIAVCTRCHPGGYWERDNGLVVDGQVFLEPGTNDDRGVWFTDDHYGIGWSGLSESGPLPHQ